MLVLAAEKDQPVEVLAATNLFYTGRLEDAEVHFRDLAQKMPDSSYVHSYLGKVLEAGGDEGAIAEYATAVHLDPTNQDALRSYAEYLSSRKDYRGAVPVLERLLTLGRNERDITNLVRALIETGEPKKALDTHRELLGDRTLNREYIDALFCSREFPAAAKAALDAFRTSNDPALLRKYLAALAQYDLPSSLDAYAVHAHDRDDGDILVDYILLLKASGNHQKALEMGRALLATTKDPSHRLVACDICAALGDTENALAEYERLISEEIRTKNNLDTLVQIISRYRKFLKQQVPEPGALLRFLSVVSKDVNIASLLETARYYEELGNNRRSEELVLPCIPCGFLIRGTGVCQVPCRE